MSPANFFFFFFAVSLILFPSSSSSSSSSSAALIAPINKDRSTRLYTLSVYLKTPLQRTDLHLDLGASFSWVDCTRNYASTSYHSIPCSSSLCKALDSRACSNCFRPPGPGCNNDTCALFPENSVTRKAIIAEAIADSLALPTTDGSNAGPLVTVPDFVFSCSDTALLKGLARGVAGLAGLGRSNFSLPAQVCSTLSAPFLFALCAPSTRSAPGVVFFGSGGPYIFSPGIDLSKSLIYTPLILNPFGSTEISYIHPSDEYFIGITAVKVNGKTLPLNQTLLTIDENGFGGTKISTATPYTVLETSIYKAFTDAFVKESAALNLTAIGPVTPFAVCYSAKNVLTTRVGPAFPTVDLVMQSDGVFWRIFGANSMVRIPRHDADVWCLGFLDGGSSVRTPIVIGGHQMEDNLLQFDLRLKRMGFSSSVLARGTACANFNFNNIKL